MDINQIITKEEFDFFIDEHKHNKFIIPESNKLMTGSYLLIDYLGRLFENTSGKHTYSDSIIYNTVEHCYNQINISKENFVKRGGIYKW